MASINVKENFVRTGFRIQKELLEEIDAIAKKKSVTRNSLVCMALADFVSQQKKIDKLTSQDSMQGLLTMLLTENLSNNK